MDRVTVVLRCWTFRQTLRFSRSPKPAGTITSPCSAQIRACGCGRINTFVISRGTRPGRIRFTPTNPGPLKSSGAILHEPTLLPLLLTGRTLGQSGGEEGASVHGEL